MRGPLKAGGPKVCQSELAKKTDHTIPLVGYAGLFEFKCSIFTHREATCKGVCLLPPPPLQLGRLKLHDEFPSVLVRLLDSSRQGQLQRPAWSLGLQALRLPLYVQELGPKIIAAMRKETRNKTYAQVSRAERGG